MRILLILILFSGPLWAAPLPLTSSSVFISGKPGLFHSPLGFSLNSGRTNWLQIEKPLDNPYIETIYRAGKDQNLQAALTVRTDRLEQSLALDKYAKKWMKDYPRFGFDVLASKKVRVGNQVGYMLDLMNRDNTKQIRQLLFVKNKAAVTLTCRDDAKNFQKTVRYCNEIFKTFRW